MRSNWYLIYKIDAVKLKNIFDIGVIKEENIFTVSL